MIPRLLAVTVLLLVGCVSPITDTLIDDGASPPAPPDTVFVPVPGPTTHDTVFVPIVCLLRDHRLRCWPAGQGPVGHLP